MKEGLWKKVKQIVLGVPSDTRLTPIVPGHPKERLTESLRRFLPEHLTDNNDANEIKDDHFTTNVQHYDTGETVMLTIYAPIIFASLRKVAGISHHDFLNSAAPKGEKYLEFSSNSKGANNFIYSHDQRLIFKIEDPNTFQFSLFTLKQYFEHVVQHPRSLLVRICGIYSLTFLQSNNLCYQPEKIHLIIMQSVFWPASPLKLEKKFDLKGCQGGRGEENSAADDSIVLKDKNFRDWKIHLMANEKPEFLQQITNDVKFLEQSLQVMDYSLLIALEPLADNYPDDQLGRKEALGYRIDNKVHPLAAAKGEGEEKRLPVASILPGVHIFESVNHRYYIGIIDIFTAYTVRQKWGRVLKTLRFCSPDHSSLPADLYAERFLSFVQDTVVVSS